MRRTLKSWIDSSGKRRIILFERNDGLFGHEEEHQAQVYDHELAERLKDYSIAWVPLTRGTSLFDTFEAAERDAKSSSWIASEAVPDAE